MGLREIIKKGETKGTTSKKPESMLQVLVVDDDPSQLRMLEHILSRHYDITTTNNPEEALDIVNDSYSAVVVDARMPDMDGFELASQIKKYHEDLPVLMYTAHPGDAKDLKKIIDAKIDAVAYKGSKNFDEDDASIQELIIQLKNLTEKSVSKKKGNWYRSIAEQTIPKSRRDIIFEQAFRPRIVGATCMFPDIVGFSEMTKSMTLEDSDKLLNSHIEKMLRVLYSHEGFWYLDGGDGLLNVFGIDGNRYHAMQSALCALRMHEVSDHELRIGLDTGFLKESLFLGTRYKLSGHAITNSKRMQSIAQEKGTALTQACYNDLGDAFNVLSKGLIAVKGIGEVELYSLLSLKSIFDLGGFSDFSYLKNMVADFKEREHIPSEEIITADTAIGDPHYSHKRALLTYAIADVLGVSDNASLMAAAYLCTFYFESPDHILACSPAFENDGLVVNDLFGESSTLFSQIILAADLLAKKTSPNLQREVPNTTDYIQEKGIDKRVVQAYESIESRFQQ